MHNFPIFDLGEGGSRFSTYFVQDSVDTTNILIMNKDQILNRLMTDAFHSQFKHMNNGWILKRDK